jgi:iron complex transport system substrate-binding protein
MIGQALGRDAQAEALITDVESTLSDLAAQHPELAGKTFSYLFTDATQMWAFLTTDARVELVSALGLQPSQGVLDLAAANPDSIVAELSNERLGDIDADVVIVEQSDGPADASRIPLLDQLEAAKAGAIVAYGTDDAALSTALIPTVLSIPWAAEQLATDLAAATSGG